MDSDLRKVREEIRQADEELVRVLIGRQGGAEAWSQAAAQRPEVRRRIELGVKVAESKFKMDPARYRRLAENKDREGLEKAITDQGMEAAVLERVRQLTIACGGDAGQAERVVVLYRESIIPETKTVQIRRLLKMASEQAT